MKKFGWPLIISAGLVVLAHYLFNQPIGGNLWQSAQGYADSEVPPLNATAFALEYVGWVAYSFYFIWLYRKLQYTKVTEAMLLCLRQWAFIAFPVVAVHYLFLGFSTTLIVLDGISTLVCMLTAGNLLWALSIHGFTTSPKPATA